MSVSRTGSQEDDESDENLGKEGQWNIVLWADHRAEEEAELINATGEGVLGFVGKTMSVIILSLIRSRVEHVSQLEMEIPKTLWLSKHMPQDRFKNCMFFEFV